eukprot:scaffold129795_cov56-Cyclotella_meneghiniana.AAC.1
MYKAWMSNAFSSVEEFKRHRYKGYDEDIHMLAFKFVQAQYDRDQDLIRRLKNSMVGGWTREQLEVTPFKGYSAEEV